MRVAILKDDVTLDLVEVASFTGVERVVLDPSNRNPACEQYKARLFFEESRQVNMPVFIGEMVTVTEE